MKNPFLLLLILCLYVSCSSDDNDNKGPFETKTITSKILAPNGVDPISGATVALSKNGLEVSSTITAADGTFSISGITNGEHQLKISKGLFSVERTFDGGALGVTIGDFSFDELPNIAVVTGYYDNIETILVDIGLVNPETGDPLFDIIDGNAFRHANAENGRRHRHPKSQRSNSSLETNVDFTFEEFMQSPELMANYDAIFFNCGLSEDYAQWSDNLSNYVDNGGVFYATDWAFEYLNDITNNGENFLQFLEPDRSGVSLETTATILNDELAEWLEVNFGISENGELYINEFLPSWQVVDNHDATVVTPWFNGEVSYYTEEEEEITENKDLMFTFKYGLGTVIYSSFHTENTDEGFTDVDRIMEFQIFNLGN